MNKVLILIALLFAGGTTFAQPAIKWSFNTKDISFGQSAAGDIDGDGKGEVVFGCYRNDSCIYALNAENGTLLWKFNAKGSAEGCNDVAPLIYDVDGDGKMEVIVASSCNPKTFCLDGKTGAVKWVCNTRGSDSPPTIADVDGDGKPEILHGEFGGYVICINAEDGTKAWEIAVDTDSWIQTAPTIADLNGDGKLDFVVATWNAKTRTNNKVYAYRGDTRQILWTYALSDVVYHGTAVGDLDGDGRPELLIGCYNDTLYCLNGENGTAAWKWSAGKSFYAGAPALIADLDNDGNCEVLSSSWYKMTALNANGTVKWQYEIPQYGQSFRSAAIGDVNKDAYQDVVFGTDKGQLIGINGNNGTLIFNKNLRTAYGDSLFTLDHAPLLADFDKNGTMDAFIVGGHGEYPDFYKGFGRAYMVSIGAGNGPDWLMFQHDVRRRGNACEAVPNVVSQVPSAGEFSLAVFPNPTAGNVTLTVRSGTAGKAHLQVLNFMGQEVAATDYSLAAGGNSIAFASPKSLPAGVYFFVLRQGENSVWEKVVVE